MSPADVGALPPQCRFVPILSAEPAPPVRLGAVVQLAEGDAPPSLILLGSSPLGCAYLGALTDARDRLLAWLELWVQAPADTAGWGGDAAGTNPEFDARWRSWAAALGADPALVATGWETVHPRPVWLDGRAGRPVFPCDPATGEPYELCTDDAALLASGLDGFSDSRRRFLAVKGRPEAGFLAATGEVPPGARPAAGLLPGKPGDLVPFNPEGGFVLARRLAPLEWEAYAGLLAGRSFRGLAAGRPPVKLGGPYAGLEDWDRLQQSGAYLFSTTRGRAGRFHETFHLKLLLLQSMLREVRTVVAATQLPCLNLGAGAFRVDLAPGAGSLPVLWTARAVLGGSSAAVALTTAGGLRHFRVAGGFGASIYRPEGAGRAVRGRGELRVRKVLSTGGRAQIEATVVSPEVALASPRDLVSARLPLPGVGAFALNGMIDAVDALAQGEARFRTAPVDAGPAVLAALAAAEGGVFPSTPFETIPLLSTPVDLFALGVLGVQLFLTGAGKPLPAALDELLSLGRAASGGQGRPGARFRALAAADGRWPQSLGPQHHGHDAATHEDAAGLLPGELWWDTLAALARFFPGAGAEPFCRDFGDAPPHQLEAAFDAPLAEIDALVLCSQSLLLCDWPTNREIARVIQKVR